jgi:hypothetical protein
MQGWAALTCWFALMLGEASGDLDLATRACNVGIVEARAGRGEDYLQNVERVLHLYFRNRGPSPSWRFLLAHNPGRRRPCARRPPAADRLQPGDPTFSADVRSAGVRAGGGAEAPSPRPRRP